MSRSSSKRDKQSKSAAVIAAADRLCAERGVRLTPLRRRVLEIIADSAQPLGAYAILDYLRAEGHQGAPPTAYRALNFLLENGFIHRIASRNVYVSCDHPDDPHWSQFLICEDCGKVIEIDNPAVGKSIIGRAKQHGFKITDQIVEARGRCEPCSADSR